MIELTSEQIERFKKLHEPYGGLEGYTDEEIKEIANGVARIYLTLFQTHQRIRKEEKSRNQINKQG